MISDKILHWPQLSILCLAFMDLGISLAKDGESKKEQKYSFLRNLLGAAIMVSLLYAGGFFS